jgi:uncharacterized membrane protein
MTSRQGEVLGRSRIVLFTAFIAVHLWLALQGTIQRSSTFHDVDLYRFWIGQGLHHGQWPVLDFPWVYPVGALAPMMVAAVLDTHHTTSYAVIWSVLVTVLDAIAVLVLIRRGNLRGAWWWLAFQAALGVIALGRLDAIAAPILVIALSLALERPRLSAALLTVGAWIKIAPGAVVVALAAAVRRPVRDVIVPAAVTCAVIVGAVVAGGGGANLFSFLSSQGTRGLQVESVAATPWVLAASGYRGIVIAFNSKIITFEVSGPGTAMTAALMDVALVLAFVALAALIWRARRGGPHILLTAALAALALQIVFNKVGSPQFICWLAAPVAAALSQGLASADRPARPTRESWHSWRVLAILLLAVAGLTQWVYPLGYGGVLRAHLGMGLVLALRNILVVVVLVMTVVGLVRAGRDHLPAGTEDDVADNAPAQATDPPPARVFDDAPAQATDPPPAQAADALLSSQAVT